MITTIEKKDSLSDLNGASISSSSSRFINVEEVNLCPICGSSDFKFVTEGKDYEFSTCLNNWKIVSCAKCSHFWLNPRPAISELETVYPTLYSAYPFVKGINSIIAKAKILFDYLKFKSIFKLKHHINSYMDLGCGNGQFLRWTRKIGLAPKNIYGLDILEDDLKDLKEEGFNILSGRIEESLSECKSPVDLITMFHIIEHISDPKETLKKVHRWLNNDGILIIETPNVNSLDARIFRKSFWGGYHFPRHWNLFSVKTLVSVLNEAGFKVESLKFIARPYTTIMSFYNLFTYGKYKSNFLGGLFNPFASSGIHMLVLITIFDKIASFLGFESSTILVVAKKKQ